MINLAILNRKTRDFVPTFLKKVTLLLKYTVFPTRLLIEIVNQ